MKENPLENLVRGVAQTPWGPATLTWEPETLCIRALGFHKDGLSSVTAQELADKMLTGFVRFQTFGTYFQEQVWQALCQVPRGETITYSGLAERIGMPLATRAVASAVARNPIAFLIPCHRVVPKTGGIGNYHWGSDIKAQLLAYEHELKLQECA